MYKLDGELYLTLEEVIEWIGVLDDDVDVFMKKFSRCPTMEKTCKLVTNKYMMCYDKKRYYQLSTILQILVTLINPADLLEQVIVDDKFKNLQVRDYVEGHIFQWNYHGKGAVDVFQVIRANDETYSKRAYVNITELSRRAPIIKLLSNDNPMINHVSLEYVGYDGLVSFTLVDIKELTNWLIEKTHNYPWLSYEKLHDVNDCIGSLKKMEQTFCEYVSH